MPISSYKLLSMTIVLIFALTACGPNATAMPTSSPQSAVLSEVQGDVSAKQATDKDFVSAADGYVLNEKGQVKTGDNSRAKLTLSSGTIIRILPVSLYTVVSNTPASSGMDTTSNLSLGSIWIILNDGQMNVQTPSGEASVRGSYMSMDFNNGILRVTCLEGTCSFHNNTGDYDIPAGFGLVSTGMNDKPTTTPMTAADIQQWLSVNPEAADIVAAMKTATPTFTATAASTATFTSTPEPASTSTATLTPTSSAPVILKGSVQADQISCRYGPGAYYLYEYGLTKNKPVDILGRAETALGTWLYVKYAYYPSPCWVNAKLLNFTGDITTLAQVYPDKAPLIMFVNPRFPPPTDVGASRNGNQVTITWKGYYIAPGDLESANSPQYMVELWTCIGGQIVFTPYGAFTESAVIEDDAGCSAPSHGQVFISHKDGYIGPVPIPWPGQ
jgi:hypothetical protein